MKSANALYFARQAQALAGDERRRLDASWLVTSNIPNSTTRVGLSMPRNFRSSSNRGGQQAHKEDRRGPLCSTPLTTLHFTMLTADDVEGPARGLGDTQIL